MDNYIDDLRMDSPGTAHDIEQAGLPTWCAFALGGIVTFLFVYIGIARPAANEIALLRRQMSSLEQSVWEVAGHSETAQSTNELLGLLQKQRSQAAEARKSLEEIRQLHQQLLAEAERAQSAMVAVSQLGSLKDMLLANSDRADQAAEVMSTSEDLFHRLANAAETTSQARQVSDDLLLLREDLLYRSGDVELARDNLDQLIDIRQTLDDEGQSVELAQDRVTELVTLKDTIVSQTGNLADAIETLELTSELGVRFHEAALAFNEIRHWMVEVVAMEPMLERARTSLEPLLELSSLRRLAPQQLRDLARSVSQQCEARVASKPDSTAAGQSGTLSSADVDEAVVTE